MENRNTPDETKTSFSCSKMSIGLGFSDLEKHCNVEHLPNVPRLIKQLINSNSTVVNNTRKIDNSGKL